jgi:hypothetical protein
VLHITVSEYSDTSPHFTKPSHRKNSSHSLSSNPHLPYQTMTTPPYTKPHPLS